MGLVRLGTLGLLCDQPEVSLIELPEPLRHPSLFGEAAPNDRPVSSGQERPDICTSPFGP